MPTDPITAARAARFGHHWDELALGWPAEFGADDADLAAAVRRLHALDDTPGPDPEFAARLLATLQPTAPPVRLAAPTRPVPVRRVVVPPPSPARRSGSMAAVTATLLLLVGTLLAGLIVGSHGPGRSAAPPLAPQADRSLPPGVLAQTILVQQRLNDLLAGNARLRVTDAVLQPGATWTVGGEETGGPGHAVVRVEQNVATLTADGPVQVSRAGSPAPIALAAGTPTPVAAGDTVYVPAGVVATWANASGHPTSLLTTRLAAVPVPVPAGVAVATLAEGEPLAGAMRPPADLLLRRVVLAADATLPGQVTGGLKLVAVEAGTVAITLAAPTAPQTTVDVRMVAAGGSVDVNDGKTFASGIQSLGPGPATLLIATLTPAFAPSPISSPPAAISAQASSVATMLLARVDGVPANAYYAQLDRATLSPGASWTIGAGRAGLAGSLGGPGAWAWLVESGDLTVAADGPVAVTPLLSQTSADQTGTFTLHLGDQASAMVGPPVALRNDTANPVTLLVASLSQHARTELPSGVVVDQLVSAFVADPPTGAVELSVQRTVFRDGGGFAGPEPGAPVYLIAESGGFDLTWEVRGTPAANANPGATPPRLVAPAWIVAGDPAHPLATIANPGPGKSTLLRFAVAPAAADAASVLGPQPLIDAPAGDGPALPRIPTPSPR